MTKIKLLLSLAMLLCLNISMMAALPQNDEVLPLDPKVRHGVLPNGLNYYVVHNEEPKERADFYIVQKVGSILEEDDQQGLAHFLEHMAFNGTTHFPGKNMLNYLQDKGIEFGGDINAATGFDQTIYYVSNVNTKDKNLCDSVLLVLYDWGNEISLLEDEINAERGVIHEEWRTRGDAQQRMYEAVLPEIYPGSKYACRLPIGTMDVVMNFKPETIRKYYEKWYRPDQQGIIVVGDIDAEAVEKQIIELFSKSTMPENPAPRTYAEVPDNKGLLCSIFTDPELPNTTVYIFFKHDVYPADKCATMGKWRFDAVNTLTQIMFMTRFQEMAMKPDAPFLGAYAFDDNYFIAQTKDAFTLYAAAKENQSLATFETLLRETRRVMQHGFTQDELERAKAMCMMSIQNQYNERDKKSNRQWCSGLTQAFTDGAYMPSIEMELQLAGELLPLITLDEVNQFVSSKVTNDNVAAIIAGPNTEGLVYPTKEDIQKSFASVLAETTEAYAEETIDMPLIENEPVPGKIVSEKTGKNGITTLKLSNGATVNIMPTDFKNDEILFSAVSVGGKWAYNGNDALTFKVIDDVLQVSALGNFTTTNLMKYLAGKNVSLGISIDSDSEVVSGSSGVKDFETLLQLNYLSFTDTRKDETAFNSLKEQLKTGISGASNNPNKVFNDSIKAIVKGHNPLYMPLTLKEVDQIDYDHVLAVAKERFGNAGDFTFNFVGNIDVEAARPLIEKYIASLPDNKVREKKGYVVKDVPGVIEKVIEMPMENPKATVYCTIGDDVKPSLMNALAMQMLSAVMDINYVKTIREEEGGTYGVATYGTVTKANNTWKFIYKFDTNIESQDRLNKRALAELEKAMTEGLDDSAFSQVKENMLKRFETNVRKNNYWLGILNDRALYGGKDNYVEEYGKALKKITKTDVEKILKKLYTKDNKVVLILDGKAKK